ncbi:hypothetical protein ORI20_30840 [Mycobacterium sp. CVI_P3]|uniref:Uncharacterized protein n=1 Tax=Mycobacterium pinniadriaticum TaxID=2994102 RepID=A0ABT3SQH2_9MYCO|nr:hypothetical protein [Mycobacterium pinniadriaticum]MCX2934670.1 hypothetical protein [Mycobacterium pinniadriaticum]MCX2941092.1 hypothetical protein [Mycobacterium pinniadriaticum]
MSKTGRTNHRRGSRGTPKPERQIIVRSVRRDPPDLRKLSRAVIAMALRDAEAQDDAREAMNGNADRTTDSTNSAGEAASA